MAIRRGGEAHTRPKAPCKDRGPEIVAKDKRDKKHSANRSNADRGRSEKKKTRPSKVA